MPHRWAVVASGWQKIEWDSVAELLWRIRSKLLLLFEIRRHPIEWASALQSRLCRLDLGFSCCLKVRFVSSPSAQAFAPEILMYRA